MMRTARFLLVASSSVAVALVGGGFAVRSGSSADAAAATSTHVLLRAPASRTAWTAGIEVPGTAVLNAGGEAAVLSVSCASTGNCTAGGYYVDGSGSGQAFVADEVSGAWHGAIELPGTAALNTGELAEVNSVSCATPGNCAAGGTYQDASGNTQAFVADEVNGVWGAAIEVPGTAALDAGGTADVVSTSCAAAGECAAGGYYTDAAQHSQTFVADEVNGTWATAIEVPGTATLNAGGTAQVSAVSCAAVSICTAAGFYVDGSLQGHAFVASDASGTWQPAAEVPGTAALNVGGDAEATTISCSPDGSCAVGGFYDDAASNSRAFLANETSGTWHAAIEVPGTATLNAGDAGVLSMSCASASSCTAGGYVDRGLEGAASRAFVVDEVSGAWRPALEVPGVAALDGGGSAAVNAVSCDAPGDCGAAGAFQDAAGNSQAFVADEVNGAWATAVEVPGTATLNTGGDAGADTVSCAGPGTCLVGGFYTDGYGPQALVDSSTLAPIVTSVTPAVGPAQGATAVVVQGENLLGTLSVRFGVRPGTHLSVVDAGAIRVAAPAGSGTVNVVVTTPYGRSAADAADRYTYALVPTITSLSPSAGPAGGGTIVTVRGVHLAGALRVRFGARVVTRVTMVNSGALRVRAPAGSGTVQVQVTTPGGPSKETARTRFGYR
jgi:hypothetical protein